MRNLKWIGLALMLPLAACSNTPEDQATRALTEMERAEPTFALIREHDPQAYGEMRALLERTVREGGAPDQTALIHRGRMIMVRALGRRMKTAPDPLVLKFAAFIADQAKSLDGNPRVCFELLMGTAGDVRSHLSAEMQQRERELVGEVLTTPGAGEGRRRYRTWSPRRPLPSALIRTRFSPPSTVVGHRRTFAASASIFSGRLVRCHQNAGRHSTA